jgi:CheY-like chemotaxis protein
MLHSLGSAQLQLPTERPRILIIDDEAAILLSMQTLLEESGFAVTAARNGKEGIAAFRANPPDLVLTDIIMPEQEGIETIMQMRREHSHVKIIAMSGGGRIGNSDFLSIAKGLGADATVAKPFDVEALIDLMHGLLATAPATESAAA